MQIIQFSNTMHSTIGFLGSDNSSLGCNVIVRTSAEVRYVL